MQRVIKGKKEAYALLGTKPSGTHQRRVKQCGMKYQALETEEIAPSFKGITSKVKRDNEKYIKCT